MDLIRLEQQQFWDMYLPRCKPIQSYSEDLKRAVASELDVLDTALTKGLSAYWKEKKDFQFNDDWNVCWHHSMGIYSERIHCKEFIECIVRVLSSMPHEWTLHVACECDSIGSGQLFFIRDKVYLDGSETLNYEEHLTTSKPGWRQWWPF